METKKKPKPRGKNLVGTKRFTVSVSEDTVVILNALLRWGAFDGKNYTEVATTLLMERIKQIADSESFQKRKQLIMDARKTMGKGKKRD